MIENKTGPYDKTERGYVHSSYRRLFWVCGNVERRSLRSLGQSQQFLAVDMIVKVKGRVDADVRFVQIIADRIMPLKVNYSQA